MYPWLFITREENRRMSVKSVVLSLPLAMMLSTAILHCLFGGVARDIIYRTAFEKNKDH